MDITRALDKRLRLLAYEFAKFGVVGTAGVFITNAVYDLLNVQHHLGPVTSATVATLAAAVVTYLGNRYWSFRRRQRARVPRELVIFAVLNGIGLLIQDAIVAFNSYVLDLGHDRLAAFVALNLGIALATLFRFWSYRRFVWIAPPAPGTGAERPGDLSSGAYPAGAAQPAVARWRDFASSLLPGAPRPRRERGGLPGLPGVRRPGARSRTTVR